MSHKPSKEIAAFGKKLEAGLDGSFSKQDLEEVLRTCMVNANSSTVSIETDKTASFVKQVIDTAISQFSKANEAQLFEFFESPIFFHFSSFSLKYLQYVNFPLLTVKFMNHKMKVLFYSKFLFVLLSFLNARGNDWLKNSVSSGLEIFRIVLSCNDIANLNILSLLSPIIESLAHLCQSSQFGFMQRELLKLCDSLTAQFPAICKCFSPGFWVIVPSFAEFGSYRYLEAAYRSYLTNSTMQESLLEILEDNATAIYDDPVLFVKALMKAKNEFKPLSNPEKEAAYETLRRILLEPVLMDTFDRETFLNMLTVTNWLAGLRPVGYSELLSDDELVSKLLEFMTWNVPEFSEEIVNMLVQRRFQLSDKSLLKLLDYLLTCINNYLKICGKSLQHSLMIPRNSLLAVFCETSIELFKHIDSSTQIKSNTILSMFSTSRLSGLVENILPVSMYLSGRVKFKDLMGQIIEAKYKFVSLLVLSDFFRDPELNLDNSIIDCVYYTTKDSKKLIPTKLILQILMSIEGRLTNDTESVRARKFAQKLSTYRDILAVDRDIRQIRNHYDVLKETNWLVVIQQDCSTSEPYDKQIWEHFIDVLRFIVADFEDTKFVSHLSQINTFLNINFYEKGQYRAANLLRLLARNKNIVSKLESYVINILTFKQTYRNYCCDFYTEVLNIYLDCRWRWLKIKKQVILTISQCIFENFDPAGYDVTYNALNYIMSNFGAVAICRAAQNFDASIEQVFLFLKEPTHAVEASEKKIAVCTQWLNLLAQLPRSEFMRAEFNYATVTPVIFDFLLENDNDTAFVIACFKYWKNIRNAHCFSWNSFLKTIQRAEIEDVKFLTWFLLKSHAVTEECVNFFLQFDTEDKDRIAETCGFDKEFFEVLMKKSIDKNTVRKLKQYFLK